MYTSHIFIVNASITHSLLPTTSDYLVYLSNSRSIQMTNVNFNHNPVPDQSGPEIPALGLANVEGLSLLGGSTALADTSVAPIQVTAGSAIGISVYGYVVTDKQTWNIAPDANLIEVLDPDQERDARNLFSETLYVGATSREPYLTVARVRADGTTEGRWFLERLEESGDFRILRGQPDRGEATALMLGWNSLETKLFGRFVGASDNQGGLISFPDGAESPSVLGGNCFRTGNSAETVIRAFHDSRASQFITIVFLDDNTIIQDNSQIHLRGGGDFHASNEDVLALVNSGGYWVEVSRSQA
jgi:hypothetical protein